MNQTEIAIAFRAQELERRRVRTEALLRNEAALRDEPLTEFDRSIDTEAVRQVREYRLELEKELSPGYWTRLWRALCGR